MMEQQLFSVKMRASRKEGEKDIHVSGAKRIVTVTELDKVCQQLLEHVLHHSKGEADAST